MVYAKQIKDEKVTALCTYDYEPNFTEDSSTVIITEEEYNSLRAELDSTAVETDQISDSEALAIITGEVSEYDA